MPNRPIIVWFRRNLRLADNSALSTALASAAPVIPVYILDEDPKDAWPLGGASHWWLGESLRSLDAALRAKQSLLVLRKGAAPAVLADLAHETNAEAVYFTRGYERAIIQRENELKAALDEIDVGCRRFAGWLLAEPDTIRNKSGAPFKVFTPFYKTCLQAEQIPDCLPLLRSLNAPDQWPESDALASWGLSPSRPDWAKEMRHFWTPGEAGARERLASFLDDALNNYGEARNRPDIDGSSRLSPHLAFGEISPRQVWHAAKSASDRNPHSGKAAASFIRELYWREFSTHLLFHWPDLPEKPFRREFEHLPWREDRDGLRAWQKGLTGYPIVDAGMRQLWAIGWMHNRVRMVAASLLTKHLLIPWQKGEAWFWDTLVDADLANNAASWQWVAGSGADAAPYFRVFNPILQGQKFDPEGEYVRRWVPELAGLPAKHIHAPWDAPASVLHEAGITLGVTYPLPVITHEKGRRQALEAYDAVKAAVKTERS
jgi:deoxyribodipyrimidine photo-lyase